MLACWHLSKKGYEHLCVCLCERVSVEACVCVRVCVSVFWRVGVGVCVSTSVC